MLRAEADGWRQPQGESGNEKEPHGNSLDAQCSILAAMSGVVFFRSLSRAGVCLLLALVGLAGSAQDGSNTPLKPNDPGTAPSGREKLIQMLSWDKKATGLVTPQNPHGLTWEFSSHDVLPSAKGQMVSITPRIFGAPTNNPWDVVLWKIDADKPAIIYKSVWLNHRGILFRTRVPDEGQQADGGDGSIGLRLGGAKGEPYRYILLSDDRKIAIYGTVVPFPNTAKQGKCSAELRLGSKDGRYLLLSGSGFSANGAVHLTTAVAEKTTSDQEVSTDAKGSFITGLMPPGDTPSGTREITISSPGCSLHFSQPWGAGTYQPE